MFQSSDELQLADIRVEREEQRRLLFVRMLKKAFVESGLNRLSQPVLRDIGIDPGAFWRATTEDKDKYKHPQRETLYRWCNAMYKYAQRREDTARYEDIMMLAGYAVPQQIKEALRRTTEELAIQKSPTTDTLGNLGDKSYRQRVQKATAATQRQFKKPLDASL